MTQLTLFDIGAAAESTSTGLAGAARGRMEAGDAAPVVVPTQADLAGAFWRGYSLDTDPDQARALFEQRFGCAPVIVRVDRGNLLAGPLPAGV